MSELTAGFQSLPPEYQRVLLLAQDQHQISVAPLQTLVGGWSGAMVFLVSVTPLASQRVEHLILKLDRKSKRPGPMRPRDMSPRRASHLLNLHATTLRPWRSNASKRMAR